MPFLMLITTSTVSSSNDSREITNFTSAFLCKYSIYIMLHKKTAILLCFSCLIILTNVAVIPLMCKKSSPVLHLHSCYICYYFVINCKEKNNKRKCLTYYNDVMS